MFRCYWTDDCDQPCREDEYIAAESHMMMCRGGRRCPPRERRANKYCCPIPRHLYRTATDSPNYQTWQSPILPIVSLACGILGGVNCPNQQQQQEQHHQQQVPVFNPERGSIQPIQQQNYDFDCRWTEECGRSCRVGEFSASQSRRWASSSNGGNERLCRRHEGRFHYCCKGPRVIWTSSFNEIY